MTHSTWLPPLTKMSKYRVVVKTDETCKARTIDYEDTKMCATKIISSSSISKLPNYGNGGGVLNLSNSSDYSQL